MAERIWEGIQLGILRRVIALNFGGGDSKGHKLECIEARVIQTLKTIYVQEEEQ